MLSVPRCLLVEVGYDAGKQVKGRQRHLLVDTLGLLIVVVVTAFMASGFRDFAGTLFSVNSRKTRRSKSL